MKQQAGQVQAVVDLVRSIYGDGFIPLHRPVFEGNEKQYLLDCIDSNFVSSVGAKVVEFEQQIAPSPGRNMPSRRSMALQPCMSRCNWPACSGATR